jgi:hypothetical protein
VIHDAAGQNEGRPSNPRSTQTTKALPATRGSTVPQVQFLNFWTGRSRRLFATLQKIVRITSAKKFDPGFAARAKSVFHLKGSLIRLEASKGQITESFWRLPGRWPGDRIRKAYELRKPLAWLKAKEKPLEPTSCDACDDEWPSGSSSGSESGRRRRRWIER